MTTDWKDDKRNGLCFYNRRYVMFFHQRSCNQILSPKRELHSWWRQWGRHLDGSYYFKFRENRIHQNLSMIARSRESCGKRRTNQTPLNCVVPGLKPNANHVHRFQRLRTIIKLWPLHKANPHMSERKSLTVRTTFFIPRAMFNFKSARHNERPFSNQHCYQSSICNDQQNPIATRCRGL